MEAGTYVLSEKRDLFAKIEHWPEFVDCGLAFGHCFFRRGEFQPCRQSLLARCRPSGAHQLKKRPAAENVKIGRVRMIGFEEPIARLTESRPFPVKSGEATFVESDGSPGQGSLPSRALMNNNKKNECRDRNWEKPIIPPGDERAGNKHDQSPRAERMELALLIICRKLTFLESLLVFWPQISV